MGLVSGVLTWVHVFGAIGWLGAAMVFVMVLGPVIGTLNPATRGELLVKLFPKYLRYIRVFAVLTILFGLATALAFANGDYTIFSPSTTFGLFLSTGGALGVITAIIAFAVVIPTANKLYGLAKAMVDKPGPPPAEMANVARRLRVASTVAMVLLVVVTILMVAAVTV